MKSLEDWQALPPHLGALLRCLLEPLLRPSVDSSTPFAAAFQPKSSLRLSRNPQTHTAMGQRPNSPSPCSHPSRKKPSRAGGGLIDLSTEDTSFSLITPFCPVTNILKTYKKKKQVTPIYTERRYKTSTEAPRNTKHEQDLQQEQERHGVTSDRAHSRLRVTQGLVQTY